MERIAVDSSMLASVGYDAEKEVLEAEFNTGRVYRYYKVPQEVFDGLMAADSQGRYFYYNIRDDYTCEEIRVRRR